MSLIDKEIEAELKRLIDNISKRNGYYGNKIPESIMRQFEVFSNVNHSGILVPFWIPVLQRGRPPRRSTKSSGLVYIIYRWMQKRNMFRSTTARGKFNEARALTWYINKYGNAHFRSKVFVDVYRTERDKTIRIITDKYSLLIGKITMQVI